MLDNFTVVFRASGDALFYVVGDADEVRACVGDGRRRMGSTGVGCLRGCMD